MTQEEKLKEYKLKFQESKRILNEKRTMFDANPTNLNLKTMKLSSFFFQKCFFELGDLTKNIKDNGNPKAE